jgi:glycosyltransferase involved in cell wall biosynthesis
MELGLLLPNMESVKKKILFCHTGLATFVKTDLDILSEQYEVISFHYKASNNILMKIANIFSSFFFAFRWVSSVDVVYVWFGGFHGFFPVLFAKLLRKKSIVIVAGYDASFVPSIEYGIFYHRGFLLWCITKIYQWATRICPVDESLVRSTNYYADPSGIGYKTGILNHLDIVEKKIEVIHLGFDSAADTCREPKNQDKIVLSIAYINVPETFIEKGFDLISKVAERMPETTFWVGTFTPEMMDYYRDKFPANVKLLPAGDYNSVKKYYGEATVIFHPSITEGFCSVIVEGMLHGCVPLGSKVGGISRSIGDTGFVIERQEIGDMVKAIEKSLASSDTQSVNAQKRAAELYPISKRKQMLFSLISSEA